MLFEIVDGQFIKDELFFFELMRGLVVDNVRDYLSEFLNLDIGFFVSGIFFIFLVFRIRDVILVRMEVEEYFEVFGGVYEREDDFEVFVVLEDDFWLDGFV